MHEIRLYNFLQIHYTVFQPDLHSYQILKAIVRLCLGLSEGDKLEITENNGMICILPVVVYPKKYLSELREEIEETKTKIASGEQQIFDNVDSLFAKLQDY